ncbi:hypothetical protein PsYK624_067380 [Phanerochaete sordida]|uniref:DUF6534 domain-containing protein n=1 Tax=Phanerochaete sordida TaxID=48140 RepID=A0A9P3LDI5_9APHY|nr:hypothetical protein PsYK624_067380 [Phanerochaete sordida]
MSSSLLADGADLPPGVSIDPLLGPFLIGTVVSAIFFGILCLQVHVYIRRSDRTHARRSSVWLIPLICLLLNALNLFASIWSCYYFMVTRFANVLGGVLGAAPWSFIANLMLTGISNSIVQSWFLWRIWLRSRRIGLVGTLGFGILVTCGIVIALGSRSASIQDLQEFAKVAWIFYVSLAFDAATNLGITIALSVYLSRARRSPLYSWDYIVSAPVIYMSNTGIICLIVIFLTFLMRLLRKDDYIFFGIFLPYSTLYANGLLGYMNSIRDDDGHADARPSLSLGRRPVNPSGGLAIHADMQRALDAAVDSPVTMDIPLGVHVEKIIDKESMLL